MTRIRFQWDDNIVPYATMFSTTTFQGLSWSWQKWLLTFCPCYDLNIFFSHHNYPRHNRLFTCTQWPWTSIKCCHINSGLHHHTPALRTANKYKALAAPCTDSPMQNNEQPPVVVVLVNGCQFITPMTRKTVWSSTRKLLLRHWNTK